MAGRQVRITVPGDHRGMSAMTTPALEREAIRLGIIAPAAPTPYPWEAQAIYEPRPLPRAYGKPRRFWRMFWVACGVVVIGGALVGLVWR